MHDPLTLAYTVRGPWLRRDYRGRLRFGRLLDVWHNDPSGTDATTCNLRTSRWQWHVHHYHVRVLPWRTFKRRHLTRCAGCGAKSTMGTVNTSGSWDRPEEKWWQGEIGLYHQGCLFDLNKARRAESEETR